MSLKIESAMASSQPPGRYGAFAFSARNGSAAGQNFLAGEHHSPYNRGINI
jgi:hypothetical protein